MSDFGFTFNGLYQLDVDALWELARVIKGEDHHLPRHKDVLIRGVIIPYLRNAAKAPKGASKDEVLRLSMVRVAKDMRVGCEDWDAASTSWLTQAIRAEWVEAFRKQFDEMSEAERQAILEQADQNLNRAAQAMGVSFVPVAGIVAGEMSGFGIYLATTTGLHAIGSAIGVTLPWAAYQGATTLLGVILGPVGWVISGGLVIAAGGGFIYQKLRQQSQRLRMVVISLIIAIGDNPYDWFELPETASLEEVQKVYRAMVKMFHPDIVPALAPTWLKHRLNQMLLATYENFDKIKKHKEAATQ
jgi:hypothetical protein